MEIWWVSTLLMGRVIKLHVVPKLASGSSVITLQVETIGSSTMPILQLLDKNARFSVTNLRCCYIEQGRHHQ
jgi:hypothetical protein